MPIVIHVRRSRTPTGTDRYQMPQGHDSCARIHEGRELTREEERNLLLCGSLLRRQGAQPMNSKITGERTYTSHYERCVLLAGMNFYELAFKE